VGSDSPTDGGSVLAPALVVILDRAALVLILFTSVMADARPARQGPATRPTAQRPLAARHFATMPQVRGRLRPSPASSAAYTWPAAFRRSFAPILNPRGAVRRVFYPLGGADVSSAFAMFAGPRGGVDELVITDVERFGGPGEVRAAHGIASLKSAYLQNKAQHSYSWFGVIGQLGKAAGLGAAIMWELELLGASDVRLEYLDGEGQRRITPKATTTADEVLRRYHERGEPIMLDARTKRTPDAATREIVRLRFTLEGRPRTLLYVQQNMLDPTTVPPVLRRFFERGFDAYFEKAAASAQIDPGYQAIRSAAFEGLHPRHGLYVSDGQIDGRAAAALGVTEKGMIPGFGWSNSGTPDAERQPRLPFYGKGR
jgi:hypothetical protein